MKTIDFKKYQKKNETQNKILCNIWEINVNIFITKLIVSIVTT